MEEIKRESGFFLVDRAFGKESLSGRASIVDSCGVECGEPLQWGGDGRDSSRQMSGAVERIEEELVCDEAPWLFGEI
jgi:hypothetical protein